MTRTLRRLARIQRIRRDEARHALTTAEQAREAHGVELSRCHAALRAAREDEAVVADELMRQHVYSLRQEMLRRRLQARAEELDAHVQDRREELVDEVHRVRSTERFTEHLEHREALEKARRGQETLDEVGLMQWSRRERGAA